MRGLLAACIVGALAAASMPAAAHGESEVKPVKTSMAIEWQLGAWQAMGGTERPAELYFVPTCPYAVCPGTLIVVWHSMYGQSAPTIIHTVSVVDHVYRMGLNGYRLAVSTGALPQSCGGAICAKIPPLGHKTMYVDTWARTVTGQAMGQG